MYEKIHIYINADILHNSLCLHPPHWKFMNFSVLVSPIASPSLSFSLSLSASLPSRLSLSFPPSIFPGGRETRIHLHIHITYVARTSLMIYVTFTSDVRVTCVWRILCVHVCVCVCVCVMSDVHEWRACDVWVTCVWRACDVRVACVWRRMWWVTCYVYNYVYVLWWTYMWRKSYLLPTSLCVTYCHIYVYHICIYDVWYEYMYV